MESLIFGGRLVGRHSEDVGKTSRHSYAYWEKTYVSSAADWWEVWDNYCGDVESSIDVTGPSELL